MDVLVWLIPVSLLLGGVGLLAFLWTVRTNQYDDPEGDSQRIPTGGTPGYSVLGLRASWKPWANLRLFSAVENITDRDYRVHGSGTNAAGRSLQVGMEWSW